MEEQLKLKKTQDAIEKFKNKIVGEVCSNIPNAFCHRKQHEVELLITTQNMLFCSL